MVDTTQLTPAGEVEIPARVRELLSLKSGDRFEVITREGEIILRRMNALPGSKELADFLARSKKSGGNKVVELGGKGKA